MATVKHALDMAMTRLTGTFAIEAGRPYVLSEMSLVWLEIQRRGATVGSTGWPWKQRNVTAALTLTGTTAVTLPLPGFKRMIAVRTADQTWNPIALMQMPARDAWNTFGDMSQTYGSAPYYWWLTEFDTGTQEWSAYFFPRANGATTTLSFLYESAGKVLVDSGLKADWCEIPEEFIELLILGTERNICRGQIRERYELAKADFENAMLELMQDALALEGGQEFVKLDSEERYRMGLPPTDDRYAGNIYTVVTP